MQMSCESTNLWFFIIIFNKQVEVRIIQNDSQVVKSNSSYVQRVANQIYLQITVLRLDNIFYGKHRLCIGNFIHTHSYRVVWQFDKAIALDAERFGFKSQRSIQFYQNHMEYSSVILSQVCIHRDDELIFDIVYVYTITDKTNMSHSWPPMVLLGAIGGHR